MGGPFEDLSSRLAQELNRQLGEAIAAVEEGARWDRPRFLPGAGATDSPRAVAA